MCKEEKLLAAAKSLFSSVSVKRLREELMCLTVCYQHDGDNCLSAKESSNLTFLIMSLTEFLTEADSIVKERSLIDSIDLNLKIN